MKYARRRLCALFEVNRAVKGIRFPHAIFCMLLSLSFWSFTTPAMAETSQTLVNLGSTAGFAVLAGYAVTNVPTSAITGDVGLSPSAESFITGFSQTDWTGYATSDQVTGKIYAADMADPTPAMLTAAKGDLTIAYNDAAGRTPIPTGPFLNPGSGNLAGLNLVPGLYKFTGAAAATTNFTLTGSASDVWIFQIASALTVSNGVHVTLAGGAQASNIFWQVGTSAVFGTNTVFYGTVMADASITMQTGATLNGRALAFSGTVALDTNTITVPSPPNLLSFAINEGDEITSFSQVTLNNACENDPLDYMASESALFAGASWDVYSTAPLFTLSSGDGLKTVYFKAKNADGESAATSDTITLVEVTPTPTNTPMPTETPTPTATPTPIPTATPIPTPTPTPSPTSSQSPVNIGSTADFAVLAGAAVTNVPTSAITGDVGVSPAATSSITGFPLTLWTGYATSPQVTGKIYGADMTDPTPAMLTMAKGDLTIAYNDAAGRTPVPTGPFLDPGSGDLAGLNLVPGLYKFTGEAIATTNFTLTGSPNDVWIFQIGTALTVSNGVQVTLAGGARASNIFWQVGSSATVGTTCVFHGTIMADQSITMQTGGRLNGRALAFEGTVALGSNTITVPEPSPAAGAEDWQLY